MLTIAAHPQPHKLLRHHHPLTSAGTPADSQVHRHDLRTSKRRTHSRWSAPRSVDDFAKAQKLFRKPSLTKFDGTNPIWHDTCPESKGFRSSPIPIAARFKKSASPKTIRNSQPRLHLPPPPNQTADQAPPAHDRAGLLATASSSAPPAHALELYGQPGSRGPSTKDGQQLELLYYAFDWAGPDVPQVMAVLCAPGSKAKPGRVVEITLMAPSL